MEFHLTLEQEQFRDSIARLVDAQVFAPSGTTATGYAEAWQAFAQLGMTGLCLPERCGGFSGSIDDIALIAIELGRAPGPTPRIEIAAAAARLLAAGQSPLAEALRDGFVEGVVQPAIVLGQDVSHGPHCSLTATGWHGDAYALSGTATAVIGGETADWLLAAATMPDGRQGVFAIDAASNDVSRTGYRLADTTPVADFILAGTRVPADALLAEGPEARDLLDAAFDLAVVAQCATAIGNIDRSIAMTVEYLKTRQQFGRSLAEFQALQHQVADLFIAASDARSIVYAAVAGMSAAPPERRRVVSACKVKVARCAKDITGSAVHLHGGIGFTTEYAIGHHHRRALVDEKLFGDSEFHLGRHLALATARGVRPVPASGCGLASLTAVS